MFFACPASSLLTTFLNSVVQLIPLAKRFVDSRRKLRAPALLAVNVQRSTTTIASYSLQPRATGSRTFVQCNVMDNPASPALLRIMRLYFEELRDQNSAQGSTCRSAFFHSATAKLPSILPSIQHHLVTVPLHLRHSSITDFPHHPSQQSTSNRTHNMIRICPPHFQSNSSANKKSQRKIEKRGAQHLSNATKAKHGVVYACSEDDKPRF